jgi:hypothetical protein
MRWKDIGLIAALVFVLTLIRLWRGATVEVLALIALFALGYSVYRVRLRQWRRRIAKLREASPNDATMELANLSPDEQAAMRIALGVSATDDATPSAADRVFEYPRTPTAIREYTFWASAIIAALAYLALVFGWDAEERSYEIALALLFTLSVGYQLSAWDRERASVRVTSFGLQAISPDGTVSGVLWSEIAGIRTRRLLMCIDFYSRDGRRLARVGYNLIGFGQFMELVLVHVRRSNAVSGDG